MAGTRKPIPFRQRNDSLTRRFPQDVQNKIATFIGDDFTQTNVPPTALALQQQLRHINPHVQNATIHRLELNRQMIDNDRNFEDYTQDDCLPAGLPKQGTFGEKVKDCCSIMAKGGYVRKFHHAMHHKRLIQH